MAEEKENYESKLEIALIKKDLTIMANLCEKIDKTIDKLQDISITLSRMVSLQEQRLDTHEKKTKDMRDEFFEENKNIHIKIDDIHEKLVTRIETIERKILDEIQKLRTEVQGQLAADSRKEETLMSRLSVVENWKLTITGAIIVGVFFLSRILDDFKFFG